MLDDPDVGDTATTLENTQPLGDEAVQTERQDEVTVEWDDPGDETVEGMCEF